MNQPYHLTLGASQGNAFTAHLVAHELIKALTAKEKAKAYAREYAKTRYVPAAERTAKVLAFSPSHSHNYTPTPTASKVINVASSHFASV